MNKRKHRYLSVRNQRGVALIVALSMLVVITLIGLMSVKGSLMQARIATNEELRIASFHLAQSLVDAVTTERSNTVVAGSIGRTVCTNNWPTASPDPCDQRTVIIPAALTSTLSGTTVVRAKVLRLPPELGNMPVISGSEYSIAKFKAATFQITAEHEDTSGISGDARVVQGAIVPVFQPSQTN